MLFLRARAQRFKPATGRNYRISRAPYTTQSESEVPSFLKSGTATVSGRTFEKRNKAVVDGYEASLKDRSSAKKVEIDEVREEFGWTGPSSQTHNDNILHDSDNEWVDEEPFHFLSTTSTRYARPSYLSQSWFERLQREQYAWDQQLSGICDEYLAYARTSPPSPPDPSSTGTEQAFTLLCIRSLLEDEPDLEHSMLVTCDGNNSAKRVASASVVDPRTFHHSYFLENDYVDRFGNEVQRAGKGKRKKGKSAVSGTQDSTATHTGVDDTAGSATSSASKDKEVTDLQSDGDDNEDHKPCEQRWKNARADESSGKKLVIFDETGIFVVSCRHGTVILVEDMRQSGELSK
ncbi:hypothetical protein FRC12_005054 [Ceratobasidium sp. 428]|nr:hypothetical protein FRC12_005054 [Ceratobasidium sp. 428]